MLTADLEKYMEKEWWGGMRLKKGKIYPLAYMDDLVLLADEEEGIKAMMVRRDI